MFQYPRSLFPKVFSCQNSRHSNEWFSRNGRVSDKAFPQVGSLGYKEKSENCWVLRRHDTKVFSRLLNFRRTSRMQGIALSLNDTVLFLLKYKSYIGCYRDAVWDMPIAHHL